FACRKHRKAQGFDLFDRKIPRQRNQQFSIGLGPLRRRGWQNRRRRSRGDDHAPDDFVIVVIIVSSIIIIVIVVPIIVIPIIIIVVIIIIIVIILCHGTRNKAVAVPNGNGSQCAECEHQQGEQKRKQGTKGHLASRGENRLASITTGAGNYSFQFEKSEHAGE